MPLELYQDRRSAVLKRVASIIREAEVFIVTAGAGMGVDSGLMKWIERKGADYFVITSNSMASFRKPRLHLSKVKARQYAFS